MRLKIVVNCKTSEEAMKVISKMVEDSDSIYKTPLLQDNRWYIYKEETCYNLEYHGRVHYSDKEYYLREGYRVISSNTYLKGE